MSRVYRRRFRVRGYELSATGHVHDSVFLNYVQQAAFEASADAGYDTRQYHAMGTIWVIRKQTIAYLSPLAFGDVVEVKTWVSDFRRVRSHREYELRRVPDGNLVALAQADWVYIDADSLFPRRIPPEVRERMQANGVSALDAAPPLEPAQDVIGRPFVYRHRAKSYELDNLRHVNNAHYLNWLNQARLDALRKLSDETQTGCPSPVRYEIEYFLPAMTGDEVQVHSQVVAVGETQLTWAHEIRRGEERLATAQAITALEEGEATLIKTVLAPAGQ